MIKVTPLFSGSRGNCTLLQTPSDNILLDLGFGFHATLARLNEANVDPTSISAIVITHEHTDHIYALKSWVRRFGTKVYAPKNCVNYISQTSCVADITAICGEFDLCGVHVDIYNCSHDARQCLGYRFSTADDCVASVTDTGFANDELVPFLTPCRTVILESNHDVDMLHKSDYHYQLKRRILSDIGHLSNEQAAAVVSKLVGGNLQNLLLGHLSQQTNTPQAAYQASFNALTEKGVTVGKDINLFVLDQYKNEVSL